MAEGRLENGRNSRSEIAASILIDFKPSFRLYVGRIRNFVVQNYRIDGQAADGFD